MSSGKASLCRPFQNVLTAHSPCGFIGCALVQTLLTIVQHGYSTVSILRLAIAHQLSHQRHQAILSRGSAMSIVQCSECNREVSTKAVACPHCGAPIQNSPQIAQPNLKPRWSRVFGLLGGLLLAGTVIVVISAHAPQPTAPSMAPTSQPAKPSHHWDAMVGHYFGYRRGLSANDQAAGRVTLPMLLVNYRGHHDGHYEFVTSDGGTSETFLSCDNACEYVTSMGAEGRRVIPVDAGSLLWDIVDDAKHGELESPKGDSGA